MKIIKCVYLILLLAFSLNSDGQQQIKFSFHFETGQSNISTDDKENFTEFYKALDSLSVDSIHIHAYCDDRGSTLYNNKLSNFRALNVKNYLLKNDTKPKIFRADGMGEIQTDPLAIDIVVQRKNNRRADVILFVSAMNETSSIESQPQNLGENLPKQKNLLTDSLIVGDKITLENILFEGGRRKLLPVSYKALDQLVSTLKSKPQYHIMILGHVCCAERGYDGIDNDTGIRNLSVVRAQTIYNYLVKNGIDEKRLESKGMKGDFPTGLGDYYDRRVEIEITSISEK